MIYDGRAAHDCHMPVNEDIVDHNLGIRSDARPEDYIGLVREASQLLSRLQTHLATDLFASATRVKLAANHFLFLAGRQLLSRRGWSA